jgi:hypothetical protein
MNNSDTMKPMLRIRANASENVKGLVSCECTIEIVRPFENIPVGLDEDIALRVHNQLTALHEVLRSKGHKLAVDGGA